MYECFCFYCKKDEGKIMINIIIKLFELSRGKIWLSRGKICLHGFQPGLTQTGLYSYRKWLNA